MFLYFWKVLFLFLFKKREGSTCLHSGWLKERTEVSFGLGEVVAAGEVWGRGEGWKWEVSSLSAGDPSTSYSQRVFSVPHKRQSTLQVRNGDILMPWSKRERLGGGSKAQKDVTKAPWQLPLHFLSLRIWLLQLPLMTGIIQYLSFREWLISLSITDSQLLN